MIQATTRDALRLFMEGSAALARAEANGVRIDTAYLHGAVKEVGGKIDALRAELKKDPVWARWRFRFGDRANMDSVAQLGELLFVDMKYESTEKTATGRVKADERAVEAVPLPFCKTYIRMRKLQKLHGTYLQGILKEVSGGRLHPSFNLNTVVTYRSSASSPNVQNIPIRNPEIGRYIRQAFIARPNSRIVELDYSGVEVRVAYLYHQDPTMRTYLLDKTTDMHRDMAAECYKCSKEDVSKHARYGAKNMFVFPQFYGSFYADCAKSLWEWIDRAGLKLERAGTPMKDHLRAKGITARGDCAKDGHTRPGTFEAHIEDVERRFWNDRFPVYTKWKEDWLEAYKASGSFTMKTGFTCRGIYRKNEVLNYAVQGAAFHCLLWAFVELDKELRRRKMKTLLVGQIHDCILADVPEAELQDFLHLAKDVMTRRLVEAWRWITIPMETESEVTPHEGSWHQKEVWADKGGVWGPAKA